MNNNHYPGKYRRGSSPHQEKEKGFNKNQIELSFSDHQNGLPTPFVDRKNGRHATPTEQRAGDSAPVLNNQI